MTERWQKLMEETARREYGGEVPASVWSIAQRAGAEVRAALLRNYPKCPPDAVYTIELVAVDAALRVARDVLYLERFAAEDEEFVRREKWFAGFGTVSSNGHTNGKQP